MAEAASRSLMIFVAHFLFPFLSSKLIVSYPKLCRRDEWLSAFEVSRIGFWSAI